MKEQAEKRYEIAHNRHDLGKPDCDAGSSGEATSEPAAGHQVKKADQQLKPQWHRSLTPRGRNINRM